VKQSKVFKISCREPIVESKSKENNELALKTIADHYHNISTNREYYMRSYTQTNFYFGLILGALALGFWKFDKFFLIVPFIIVIQYSIVQWNQYHQFLSDIYLEKLEDKINKMFEENTDKSSNINFYTFYNELFGRSVLLKCHNTSFPLIKPTAILSTILVIVNLSIFVYSLCQGYTLLDKSLLKYVFLVVPTLMLVLLLINFALLPKNIKPLLESIYDDSSKCRTAPH
jgi:hypothetical protein